MQSLAPPTRLLHCFRRQPKTPYKQSLFAAQGRIGRAQGRIEHCEET
jgi:hypothetical protein